MTFRKNIFAYILIFLTVQAVLFSFLSWTGKRDQEIYFSDKISHYEGEYKSIIASFSRLAYLAVEEIFKQDDIMELFAQASRADEKNRDQIRTQLYQKLLPSYDRIIKKNFRNIHFHFADGTSFLRMHLPHLHGDNLFAARPSLRIANMEKRYVEGFEIGRNFHAFRYVFPLTKDGVHFGTVEVSVPFYAVNTALKEIYQAEYLLILKKDVIAKTLFSESNTNYTGAYWAEGYLYEKTDLVRVMNQEDGHIPLATLSEINRMLSLPITEPLNRNNPFAEHVRFGGNDYLISFLPVIDIGNFPAGYLISYSIDSTLASLRKGYLIAHILATVFVIILFGGHMWSSRKIMNDLRFQQQLMDSIPTPICFKDRKGVFKSCNEVFAQMLGLPKEKIIGEKIKDVLPLDVAGIQENLDQLVTQTGKVQKQEMAIVYPDKSRHDMITYKAPFVDAIGQVRGIIGSTFDVTERKQAEKALRNSHFELDQIFNTAANGMRVVDKDHVIVRANATFCNLIGLPEDEVVGKKCFEVFPGLACHTEKCPLIQAQKGTIRLEMEIEKTLPSGQKLFCVVTSVAHFDENGKYNGIIEDFKDISRHKELEEKLRNIAISDELTGLFNRRGFLTLAEKQLSTADRTLYDLFLFFADLDNMKEINDSLGHETGDDALRVTADILRRTFRQSDIVSRLGGDEFAVLISSKPGTDSKETIVQRLEKKVSEENNRKINPFIISISYGIVQYKKEESLEQLMSRADQLMYACKSEKKNCRKFT